MLAYFRERERTIQLTKILEDKENLGTVITNKAKSKNLVDSCWDMLSSNTYNRSMMILDSNDVLVNEIVRGNIPRRESL